MLKFTLAFSKVFGLFTFGVLLAFPISAMFGAIAIFLTYLPIIWEILWRTGLGLMMMTAIALFFEGVKKPKTTQPKNNL